MATVDTGRAPIGERAARVLVDAVVAGDDRVEHHYLEVKSDLDLSTKRDGRVTRSEHYAADVLVRAEEDVDGDGRSDKWETYERARLVSVAFDTVGRGTADRRIVYEADGSARLEADPEADGTFAVVAGR